MLEDYEYAALGIKKGESREYIFWNIEEADNIAYYNLSLDEVADMLRKGLVLVEINKV